MLYVFHGSDVAKSREKAHKLLDSLQTKRPDAMFVTVSADNWVDSVIEEHLGGQGLFSNKYVVFLDRVTENTSAKEIIADFIPAMNESANIFIALEGKLNAEFVKAFGKSAEKVVVTDLVERTVKSDDFNIFALADAVGSRDAYRSWSIFRQAIDNGIEPESIAGTLFWQLKSISLASGAKSAKESGLSPFVFMKSKKYANNFKDSELEDLTQNIVRIYHDAHRGVVDMELEMEMVMLGV